MLYLLFFVFFIALLHIFILFSSWCFSLKDNYPLVAYRKGLTMIILIIFAGRFCLGARLLTPVALSAPMMSGTKIQKGAVADMQKTYKNSTSAI